MSEKEITLISKLGEGAYGAVFKCKNKKGETLALKKSYKDKDVVGYKSSLSEINILKELQGHPFIINIFDIYLEKPYSDPNKKIDKKRKDKDSTSENIFYTMEIGENTLDNYKNKYTQDDYFQIKLFIIQILIALEYSHKRSIIHRDLSISNIVTFDNTFINNKDTSLSKRSDDKEEEINKSLKKFLKDKSFKLKSAKIIDFGLSGFCSGYDKKNYGLVTAEYRAPELCARNNYDERVDIWALGCIVYEAMRNSILFPANSNNSKEPNRAKLLETIINNYPCENFDLEAFYRTIKTGNNKINILNIKKKKNTFISFSSSKDNKEEEMDKERLENFNNTPGNFDEFLEIIQSMFEIDYNKRKKASQILEMKFFEGYRDYIEFYQNKYEPTNRYLYKKKTNEIHSSNIYLNYEEENFQIIKSKERKWGMEFFVKLFNLRKEVTWYNHFILFQGMRLYDMYISYRTNESNVLHEETEDTGKIGLNKETCVFYAKSCIFIMFKFYIKLESYYDFNKLFGEKLDKAKQDKNNANYLIFEKKILELSEFRLFRYHIYEYLNDNYFDENKTNEYKEKEITYIFNKYVNLKELQSGNIKNLFDRLLI
jgi:serine/threonine protein kinase